MSKVILFSTGCPLCKTLKQMLNNYSIPYVENNSVEYMISLGFTTVPVLSVDGKIMEYNEAKNWIIQNGRREMNEKQ